MIYEIDLSQEECELKKSVSHVDAALEADALLAQEISQFGGIAK